MAQLMPRWLKSGGSLLQNIINPEGATKGLQASTIVASTLHVFIFHLITQLGKLMRLPRLSKLSC